MSRSTISLYQLSQMFPNEETARKYMEARRWPNGPVCSGCGEAKRIGTRKNGYYRCNPCKVDFTVRLASLVSASFGPRLTYKELTV